MLKKYNGSYYLVGNYHPNYKSFKIIYKSRFLLLVPHNYFYLTSQNKKVEIVAPGSAYRVFDRNCSQFVLLKFDYKTKHYRKHLQEGLKKETPDYYTCDTFTRRPVIMEGTEVTRDPSDQ